MAAEAWKIAGQSKAALEPIIFDKGIVKDFCLKNINRLLISACDIDYLRQNIECLFSYKKSNALIPYIVFVLCGNSNQEAELRSEIKKISDKVDSKKILLTLFSCDAMAQIQRGLCATSYNEYKVNYIRCARFCLVQKIWEIIEVSGFEKTIIQASTYIMDFDNIVNEDFNSKVKSLHGNMRAVFCWDKDFSPRQDFTNSLSSFLVKGDNSFHFELSHKVLKAGFVALAPSFLSRLFLALFNVYSLSPEGSLTNHRLFSFYYGDQLSIFNSLREIRDNIPILYKKYIGWIDCTNSELVNLNQSKNASIWMPKGGNTK